MVMCIYLHTHTQLKMDKSSKDTLSELEDDCTRYVMTRNPRCRSALAADPGSMPDLFIMLPGTDLKFMCCRSEELKKS